MHVEESLTSVVVNYQTPDLLTRAVRSFHEAYPGAAILIVDNGSADDSPEVIDALEADYPDAVRQIRLSDNIYHGPAMHLTLEHLETRYVYFFDSDTVTRRTGFLEPMVDAVAADDDVYGAGRVLRVDKRGFPCDDGTPILWAPYMLIDRRVYGTLPPFEHHGVPVLKNMQAAAQRGYRLVSFPIAEYVDHLGQGTASRYGYGLGFKSRFDRILHRAGMDRLLERIGL